MNFLLKTSHKHIKYMNTIYPKETFLQHIFMQYSKWTFSRKAGLLISGWGDEVDTNLLRPRKPCDKLWNRDNSRYVYNKIKETIMLR